LSGESPQLDSFETRVSDANVRPPSNDAAK
jgi:hypothetical protein